MRLLPEAEVCSFFDGSLVLLLMRRWCCTPAKLRICKFLRMIQVIWNMNYLGLSPFPASNSHHQDYRNFWRWQSCVRDSDNWPSILLLRNYRRAMYLTSGGLARGTQQNQLGLSWWRGKWYPREHLTAGNLNITQWKRKVNFQATIFGFPVNFPGCSTLLVLVPNVAFWCSVRTDMSDSQNSRGFGFYSLFSCWIDLFILHFLLKINSLPHRISYSRLGWNE